MTKEEKCHKNKTKNIYNQEVWPTFAFEVLFLLLYVFIPGNYSYFRSIISFGWCSLDRDRVTGVAIHVLGFIVAQGYNIKPQYIMSRLTSSDQSCC